LEAKRCNVFTLVGNTSRTFREGVEANESWFIDDLTNLDNFKEELSVAVYNVFLQQKKVPYTSDGLNLLSLAMSNVCDRYVVNGAFSERPSTITNLNAPSIESAYTITFASLSTIAASDRASRQGPPASIDVNLAGAIHKLTINVEAYS